MLTNDVIVYYSNLLIMEYASFGNAVGTVQAYVGELIQNQVYSQLQTAFVLQSAVGSQLGILGTYRGVYRQVFGLTVGNYWAMPSYVDLDKDIYSGWATYAGTAPTNLWLQFNDSTTFTSESVMTDAQLRRMINFKILLDSQPLTLGNIDNILFATFGVYVNLVDNGDMTITYQHQAIDPDPEGLWAVAVLSGILPNPCGVLFTTVTI